MRAFTVHAYHEVHHGILRFVGFTVLEPFVVYGPARLTREECAACLARYGERVLSLGDYAGS
jgi:NAD(P)H dehydrogenase (quinone)